MRAPEANRKGGGAARNGFRAAPPLGPLKTTSVFGENTYSYGGKTYESQTELFEQLSKDGLMQATRYYVGNVLERSTFRWI